MDYTKNYHLPQWVDEDRIMRKDFNNAMANIENGLTEGRTESSALNTSLIRLAYNNWQQMSAMPEIPYQDGGFRQGFRQGENPYDKYVSGDPTNLHSVNGMAQLPDRVWTANWDQALHMDIFRSTFRVLSSISTEAGTDTAIFTFTPPAPGYVYNVILHGTFEGNSQDSLGRWLNDGSCTVRVYNDITEELLQETPSALGGATNGFAGTRGWGFFRIPFAFYLHGKVRYRFEIQMKKMNIPLDYTPDPSVEALTPILELYGRKQENVTFTRQVRAEGGGRDGLILVRYDTWGPEGSVSAEWLGETLTPSTVRTVDFRGLEVREAEFRLGRPVPADSTVSLTLHCGKDGEFSLFDWGAVVI